MARLLPLLLAAALAGCRAPPPFAATPDEVPCWAGQPLGTHGRVAFFCENNRVACVAQPANTWSNAAYLLGAGAIAATVRPARRRAATPATTPAADAAAHRPAPDAEARAARVFGALLAAESLYLGVGSGLFHASVTAWAERLDLSGTYGVVLALLGFAAARLAGPARPGVVPGAVAAVLGVQAVLTVFKWHVEDFLVLPIVVVALVGALVALTRQGRVPARAAQAASASAVAAGAVWAVDLSRVACAPDTLLQGHAAWHVLTAVAVVLAFRALRGGAA